MNKQMNTTSMVFNCLLKKDGDIFIGHCLELDIVATGNSIEAVKKDLADLILAQVDYAFSNDNLENLYRPAPPEVWKEFYACRPQTEDTVPLKSNFSDANSMETFVPPWIIAKTCLAKSCRV